MMGQRVPRVLMLGLGEQGSHVVAMFLEQVAVHHGPQSTVSGLALLPPEPRTSTNSADDPSEVLGLEPLVLPDVPDQAGREALNTALRVRLWAISRLRAGPATTRPAAREVWIVTVAAATDEWSRGWLQPALRCAQELVHTHLRAQGMSVGLWLLPPAAAFLEDLQAAMRPTDEDGETFDGEMDNCFLLGSVNTNGQVLEDGLPALALAAEGLYLALISPLGRAARALESDGEGTVASFGWAAWIYPAEKLVTAATRRLALERLDECLKGAVAGEQDVLMALYGHLAESKGTPAALAGGLVPENVGELFGPGAMPDLAPRWSIGEPGLKHPLSGWPQTLDNAIIQRLMGLYQEREGLVVGATQEGEHLAQSLTEVLRHEVQRRLADALCKTRLWQGALADLAGEQQSASEVAFETLNTLDEEAQALAGRWEEVAATLPCGWRAWLRALPRWWRLWRTYQALRRIQAMYHTARLRWLAQIGQVLAQDLAAISLKAAAEGLGRWDERLETFKTDLIQARRLIARQPEPALYGSQAVPVALSILTPALVEQLYSQIANTDAVPPLSAWLEDGSDPETLARNVLAWARQFAQVLGDQPLDKLVEARWPEPETRTEALETLHTLAAPFLAWEEVGNLTTLTETTVLACPPAQRPGVWRGQEDGLPSRWARWRVIPAPDPQRWTMLRVVRGLTWEAVQTT